MNADESNLSENTTSAAVETNTTHSESLNDSGNDLNAIEKLLVSSDDEKDEENISPVRARKKREMKILDSDSEDEKDIRDGDGDKVDDAVELTKNPDERELEQEPNQDEEEEKFSGDKKDEVSNGRAEKDRYKGLIDSDTESESERSEQNEEEEEKSRVQDSDNEENEGEPKHLKKKDPPPPKRMSAKVAMEQMKSIKSESQRFTRENYIDVPYHRPKQYSLKEFMNRKSLSKPSLDTKNKSIKMNQEELIEFAKQLEERAKEATDFFKSESEEEEELPPSTEKITDAIVEKNDDADDMAITYEEKNDKDATIADKKNDEEIPVSDENIEQEESITNESNKVQPIIDKKNNEGSPITDDRNKEEEPRTGEKIEDLKINEEELPNTQTTDIVMDENKFQSEDLFEKMETEENENESELPESETYKPATIKDFLKEHEVMSSPVLKGTPNMFIDLETGDVISPKLSGVDQLFQRFLNHSVKRKPKEKTNMSIVSTENGTLEITNISVPLIELQKREQKPGANYTKLMNDLKQVISKKRKDALMKRVQENVCSEEDDEFDDELDDLKKEKYYDEEENEEEFINEFNEEVNEQEEDKEGDEQLNHEIEDDEEKLVEADDEYDSDESEDDDDDELCELPKKSKNRIITAFEDSDDENIEKDNPSDHILAPENSSRLWNDDDKQQSDCEDELLGLCSGRFDPTQKKTAISQIPTTQLTQDVDENELLALCSGKFQENTQTPNEESNFKDDPPLPLNAQLETSDEEDGTTIVPPIAKLKQQKKKRKLSFTDDEESADEAADLNNSQSEKEEVEELEQQEDLGEEIPATYIDYDSEENEIEVQMTKKDCQKKANEFFENEAELSESEWGSADEDEKDMDRYDIDAADEEQFDKDELKSELGKIHMRRMLDDDIREVKKIQELLFEDEETDGIGRQRQFKWKNLEGGFSLEVQASAEADGKNESDDDGEELLWRKMRYEREVLLKENPDQVDNTKMASKPQELNSSMGKKLTIVNMNACNTTVHEQNSPFLIAKSMTANRGSFLIRDKDTLSKLASMTKSSFENDGEIAPVQVRSVKAKNFVFATAECENTVKRKSVNSDPEIEYNQRKKIKINTIRKERLIDHLS